MSTPTGLTIVRAEVYGVEDGHGAGPSKAHAVLHCSDDEQTQLFCYSVEDCLQWFALNHVSEEFEVIKVETNHEHE